MQQAAHSGDIEGDVDSTWIEPHGVEDFSDTCVPTMKCEEMKQATERQMWYYLLTRTTWPLRELTHHSPGQDKERSIQMPRNVITELEEAIGRLNLSRQHD